ncbi:hypothetical protein LAJ57_14330, partial [Streptococcus pneumoniae]|uniref:hypothetical protein n=1 Tax=Streptococcus pneumoniae TaxID=1313 RepID=UPI001CBDF58C
IHYRDEVTNKPVSFSSRAGIQINIGQTNAANNSVVNISSREDGGLTSTPLIVGDNGGGGNDVRKWTRSHQPGSPVL